VFTRLITLRNGVQPRKKITNYENIPRITFIDFKNAFDSVKWDKLFSILRDNNILNEDEIKLLKFIYTNVTISNGYG